MALLLWYLKVSLAKFHWFAVFGSGIKTICIKSKQDALGFKPSGNSHENTVDQLQITRGILITH